MKNLKKILALVLALTMVLSMSAVVFADDDTTEDPLAGHSFTAYQIFSGTQTDAEGDSSLGSIEWGSGIKSADFLGALKQDATIGSIFTDCNDAKDVAAKMTGDNWKDDSAYAKAFAAVAHKFVTDDGAEPGDTLDAGYYLVVDTTSSTSTEGFAYNLSLLQLTKKGDFEVTPKIGVPEVIKKILDDGEVDVNEAAIGESVDYQITGTMPTNIGDYKEYYYQFNDTLSKGLTYNDDLTIMIGSVEVTDYFFVDASDYSETSGTTIKATIGDLLALNNLEGVSITADTEVVITYSATLNENAVIAGAGNPNEVTLKYSNKPNDSGVGHPKDEEPEKPEVEPSTEHPTGDTPKDEVKTFVTELTVKKTDGTNILTGAEFQLVSEDMHTVKLSNGWTFESDEDGTYYKLKNGSYTEEVPHESKYMKEDPDGAYVVGTTDKEMLAAFNETIDGVDYCLKTAVSYEEGTTFYTLMNPNAEDYELTAGMFSKVNGDEWVDTTEGYEAKAFVKADGTLTFTGLGAGTYTLKETTAPAGYNAVEDITFTVSFDDETATFSTPEGCVVTVTDNKLATEVVNQKGSTLPETGGIGTTIFYVLGSVLLAGAAVLLITKKRMSAEV